MREGRPTHFVERWITKSGGKTFRQGRYFSYVGKVYGLNGTHMPLYNLCNILKTPKEKAIIIAEGEKDADTLRALGFEYVTTVASGAGASWKPEYTEVLRDHVVILFPDNDSAGRDWMDKVARNITRC